MDDERRLTFWVIYKCPKDHPHDYVLRRQHAMGDGSVAVDGAAYVAGTAELLREKLPPGLTKVGPWKGDDPVIYEVWV